LARSPALRRDQLVDPGALTLGGRVVPKHRRSEIESLLPSAGVNTADFLPEAVGYGQATATAWPPGMHSRVGPPGNGYPAANGYDGNGYDGAVGEPDWATAIDGQPAQDWQDWQDWGPPPAMHPDHPSAPVPRVQFPADHPSGPMPAVRGPRAPGLPQRQPGGSARTWNPPSQPGDAGHGNGTRRLFAVPDDASALDYPAPARRPTGDQGRQLPGQRAAGPPGADRQVNGFHRQPGPRPAPREAIGYQRRPGPPRHDANGYQRQNGQSPRETIDYRRETGPFGPGPGPAPGRFRDFRSPNRDPLRASGQALEVHHGLDRESDQVGLADGRSAQITREAQDYAASIREAAEREAATITQQATGQAAAMREAMEREAAELRARLDSMTGELSRVASYVTQNLAPSAMPGTAPVLPDAMPDLGPSPAPPETWPGTRPARPETAPRARPARPAEPDAWAQPGTRPARPETAPRARPARPADPDAWARPDTRPARPQTRPGTRPDTRPGRPDGPPRPRTTPAKGPQKRTRQQQAMRVATMGTAALLSVALISTVAEISMRGLPFFVFRQTGTGETGPAGITDQQFLANEAAAAHHATTAKVAGATGRHHRKAHAAVVVHTKKK
jgi:hypothetical protein